MKKKFTLVDLISFGAYLLSDERTTKIKQHPTADKSILKERLRMVSDADIQNWKHLKKQVKEN